MSKEKGILEASKEILAKAEGSLREAQIGARLLQSMGELPTRHRRKIERGEARVKMLKDALREEEERGA